MNELILQACCVIGLTILIQKICLLAKRDGVLSLIAEHIRITLMLVSLLILLMNGFHNILLLLEGSNGNEVFLLNTILFWMVSHYTYKELKTIDQNFNNSEGEKHA